VRRGAGCRASYRCGYCERLCRKIAGFMPWAKLAEAGEGPMLEAQERTGRNTSSKLATSSIGDACGGVGTTKSAGALDISCIRCYVYLC
jgi:hypothetical protein